VNTIKSISETTELFDRTRLLVDLDEASDPESPAAVLVVVGLRGLGEAADEPVEPTTVEELRDRFTAIVGASGAVYRTRSTELCAILDGDARELASVLDAVQEVFATEAAHLDVGVSTGFVELPREAHGAPEALELADRRMTAADGPIRQD
jgi:hypothetical protein